MKNQLFITVLTSFILLPMLVPAQQTFGFKRLKKNGFSIEPIAAFTGSRELRLSYDRALGRNSAFIIEGSFSMKNGDPDLQEVNDQRLVSSFTRETSQEITWFLFIPSFRTTSTVPLPQESESISESRFLKSHIYVSGEFRFYMGSNSRSKLQNGFYLAPGLSVGRKTFAVYDHVSGSRNEVEVLNSDSDSWGVPLIVGITSSTSTEQVSVFSYNQTSRSTEKQGYVRPSLSAGYQFPIGGAFSADLGGRLFFRKQEPTPESEISTFLNPFGGQSSNIKTSATASLRISFWF